MIRLGSLCSGYGGLDLAAEAVLGPLVHCWHAEVDPHASVVLEHHWPGVPNLGDIRTVDWTRVPPIDVCTAGYPCQPLSLAGHRKGVSDERWIWDDVLAAVRVLRPRLLLLENVPGHLSLGFGRVLGDLAAERFDAEWGCLRAADVGAPHSRERVFVVAWPRIADAASPGLENGREGRLGGEADGGGDGSAGGAAAVVVDRGDLTLLPTPRSSDARGSGPHGTGGLDLRTAVLLLPTPTARLGDRWGAPNAETAYRRMYDEGRRNLEDAVSLLPTPRVAAVRTSRSAILASASGPSLEQALELARGELPRELRSPQEAPAAWKLLPTPRASDGAKGGPHQRGSSGDLMLSSAVVQLLPTATATPYAPHQSPSDRAAVRLSLDTLAGMDRWGAYAAAIARWEQVTGFPAPPPTQRGARGQQRLSPALVEWMMGVPPGWVTSLIPRNPALRCLGNGVVPQQAAVAYAGLLRGMT